MDYFYFRSEEVGTFTYSVVATAPTGFSPNGEGTNDTWEIDRRH